MSFVKDLLFGEKPQPATVQSVDTRSPGQVALNDQTMNALREALARMGGTVGAQSPTGVAPITSNEQQLLDMIMGSVTGQAQAGTPGTTAMDTLSKLATMNGSLSPLASGRAGAEGMALIENILSGRTMDPASNPNLEASIRTAQRPLLQQFEDELAGLTSAATRYGQYTGGNASSPFEAARMRLQGDLAGALGDVSTRLVAENFSAERQRQLELLGLQSGAFESGANRALTAATAIPGVARGQLETLMTALEAQALPRMVEQLGIEQGTAEFNRQQQQFMQLLGLALSGSSGGVGTVTVPGTEGSTGLIGSLLGAAGTAFGTPLGTTLGTKLASAFG